MKISQLPSVVDLNPANPYGLIGTELIEVSQPAAAVTYAAWTISAQASDNSYNDSAAGFITAGFAVGDTVRIEWPVASPNSIFSATITDLTDSKMTIGGTDGDVIVDAAEGGYVLIQKWQSARTRLLDIIDTVLNAGSKNFFMTCSDETTPLTTGLLFTFHLPNWMNLNQVYVGLTTPQASGAIFTVDVKCNGTSIFTTKITIDNTLDNSLLASVYPELSVTSFSQGDRFTVHIDQIGDGTATGLKLYLIGT